MISESGAIAEKVVGRTRPQNIYMGNTFSLWGGYGWACQLHGGFHCVLETTESIDVLSFFIHDLLSFVMNERQSYLGRLRNQGQQEKRGSSCRQYKLPAANAPHHGGDF